MGIVSLVFGIIGLVLCWIPVINWLGILLSLVGIIMGALGRKNPEKKGIATAGLVLSIIGFVLGVIFFFACGGAVALGLM